MPKHAKRSSSKGSKRSGSAVRFRDGGSARKILKRVSATERAVAKTARLARRDQSEDARHDRVQRLVFKRAAVNEGRRERLRAAGGSVPRPVLRTDSVIPYGDYHAAHTIVAAITPTGVPGIAGPGCQVQRALSTRGNSFVNVTVPAGQTFLYFAQPWCGVGSGYYLIQGTNFGNNLSSYSAPPVSGQAPINADNGGLVDGNILGYPGAHFSPSDYFDNSVDSLWALATYVSDPFNLPNFIGSGAGFGAGGNGAPWGCAETSNDQQNGNPTNWNTFAQYSGGMLQAQVDVPFQGQANVYTVGSADNDQVFGNAMPGSASNLGDIADSLVLREGPLCSRSSNVWSIDQGGNKYATAECLDIGIRTNYRPQIQMGGSSLGTRNYAVQLPNSYGETWTRAGSSQPPSYFNPTNTAYTDSYFGIVFNQSKAKYSPVSQPIFAWLENDGRPGSAECNNTGLLTTQSLLRPGNLAMFSNGMVMVDNVGSTPISVQLKVTHSFNISVLPQNPQYPLSHPVRKHTLPSNGPVGGCCGDAMTADQAVQHAVVRSVQAVGPANGQPILHPVAARMAVAATVAPSGKIVNGYVPTSTIGDPLASDGATTLQGDLPTHMNVKKLASTFGANALGVLKQHLLPVVKAKVLPELAKVGEGLLHKVAASGPLKAPIKAVTDILKGGDIGSAVGDLLSGGVSDLFDMF